MTPIAHLHVSFKNITPASRNILSEVENVNKTVLYYFVLYGINDVI
jgi:hypothetical protein